MQKKELLVIALGGNALVEEGKKGTSEDHLKSISKTFEKLLPLFEMDYDIVISHGNGPQVGNILIQNEETAAKVPSMPLDVCVAESQGEIGYFLQQSLTNIFLPLFVIFILSSLSSFLLFSIKVLIFSI